MALKASQLKVADVYSECVVENLTRTQIVQYAGASGDYNPIHSDEVYAVYAGHKGVFAHGMLTMGLTGRMLTNYVGDARLVKFGVRFLSQVWPGDTLTATATVTELNKVGDQDFVELAIATVNQEGKEVLTGHATARIDP
ncbi:MaoC/PaaZ C-terminal domain-containing protein [Peristeroidobacter soli]|uniref:MaoC/PaaZ C-terminal domain-containing protein n=1 Tax=Peristeroidobacter soli TaxID=2497877 RepID=UPI00101C3AD0|nr:MaoC/PaaZ C-terminal domain-containing protein [Peristeroidobacter soli]